MSDIAILVVDSSPEHRELTVLALSDFLDPARIATAADGVEALDYLFGRGNFQGRDARKQPRLVLMDIHLPRLDGVEVLKAMRANADTLSIPVVMLSAASDKSELDGCYRAGANSVVSKSADYEELRGKMKHVYGFWMTVNEANRNSRV
jgi:two-component system response regulator